MKVLQLAASPFFPSKDKVIMLSNATIFISDNGILATVVSCTLVRHHQKEGSADLDSDLF
ncbi:MAG: hypothetical protein MRJ67_00835 [Nitrospirales bacterium]|nr:hypothetical protein [Nitrospirales bacterium]